MKKRGPASGADLSVVPPMPELRTPPPPAYLTTEQGGEWRRIVAAMPAGFFGQETWPILAAHVANITACRRVAERINLVDPATLTTSPGLERYDVLLRAQARQTNALLKTATKLRLTPQSRYTPKAAGTAHRNSPKGRRPWE